MCLFRLKEMARLTYLNNDMIEEIHSTALQLLESSGVRVANHEARAVLEESGCIISNDIVKISEPLVKECLKSVPSIFSLFSRDGKETFTIGEENVFINPGSSAAHFKDRISGVIRKGTSKDIIDLIKVVEQLEHIKFQSTALIPSDIPIGVAGFYRLYVILKNSRKPVVTGAFSKDDFSFMRKILELVSGGTEELAKKPQAIFDCCPTSPMVWNDTASQNLIDCAKARIPAQIVPAPLMGVSSPVTITGTLVQQNIEILSGVVIAQLVNPGTPIIYGGAIGSFDMRYGTPRFSSVEATMTACMSNEIGKSYRIPTHAYLGISESKIEDAQSGYETGLGLIMGILSRINVISGPGLLAQLNCLSLEKLVIDNEFCGSALRLINNFDDLPVNEISDLISSVGPGGDYLKQKHTLKNYRTKHLYPSDILSRLNIQSWIEDGQKTTFDQAKVMVDKLLKEETVSDIPRTKEEQLDKVYAEAKKTLS